MPNPYLDPLYHSENELQAINAIAGGIEQTTGIAVVRCHLGNPLAPQFEPSNQLAAKHFKTRSKKGEGIGYEDVAGNPETLERAARRICHIDRLPKGSLTGKNIIGATGGTGALNIAMLALKKPGTILVQDPFYPPVKSIAQQTHHDFATFPINAKSLWDHDTLAAKIKAINDKKPNEPILLLYHYPNNPTGKTLTKKEAEELATSLNILCEEYPNLHLAQEDIYLATTAADKAIYTPLPYLDDNAKQRTIVLVSPTKMGHSQDRGAFIAAFDTSEKGLVSSLRGAVSRHSLGTNQPSLRQTARTLREIAKGRGSINRPKADPENYRYFLGNYYQQLMNIIGSGIQEIEDTLGQKMLPGGVPKGAYYLYPSFDCLKGKLIPKELASLPDFKGKKIFENADDVTLALQHAHLIGLQPLTVASGTLFTDEHKHDTMKIRIAAVEPSLDKMRSAANTLKGLVEKTLNVTVGRETGFYSLDELKALFPVKPPTSNRERS